MYPGTGNWKGVESFARMVKSSGGRAFKLNSLTSSNEKFPLSDRTTQAMVMEVSKGKYIFAVKRHPVGGFFEASTVAKSALEAMNQADAGLLEEI